MDAPVAGSTRPTRGTLVDRSVNQSDPSGAAAIASGMPSRSRELGPTAYSVTLPAASTRPMPPLFAAYQTVPPGPAARPDGTTSGTGRAIWVTGPAAAATPGTAVRAPAASASAAARERAFLRRWRIATASLGTVEPRVRDKIHRH